MIREDPINPNVLYVGTDMGVFVSINKGLSWEVLQNGIPISPSHDMVIHSRDRELVVGTHGRSIYVMDIEPIQKLTDKVRKKTVHLFEPKPVREKLGSSERKPSGIWREPDDLTANIYYWLADDGPVDINIKDNDDVIAQISTEGCRGINLVHWDMTVDRESELKRRLIKANKELKKTKEKLRQAGKETEKKDPDKDKIHTPEGNSDNNNKKSEEVQKIKLAIKKEIDQVQRKIKDINSLLNEPKKYSKLSEKTREKIMRTIYASKGDYLIEVKFGDNIESSILKVGSNQKPKKLDTKTKRLEETKRLLSEYEINR